MIFEGIAAYHGDQPYIFLSYSHKDAEQAEVITRGLLNKGFRVWYDEGLTPGQEWDDNVARAVENCDYMIALISRNYLDSENCRDELNYARDKNKRRLLIYLEDIELPGGMAMRLGRQHALFTWEYRSTEALIGKLDKADGIGVCRGEAPDAQADTKSGEQTVVVIPPENESARQSGSTPPPRPLAGRIAVILGAAAVAAIVIVFALRKPEPPEAAQPSPSPESATAAVVQSPSSTLSDDTVRFADGVYAGQLDCGKRSGHGTMSYDSGASYVGEWKDDKKNGQGTFVYVSGGKYVGQWKDDNPNGPGTFYYANGDVLVAEWVDNKLNGAGTYTYANGDVLVAEWVDNKLNGAGTYTYANGTVEYQTWENDKLIG